MDIKRKKQLTKKEQQMIVVKRKQGKSIKAIASEMHISDKRVSSYLRFLGRIRQKNRGSSKQRFNIMGNSFCTIAEESTKDFIFAVTESSMKQINGILGEDYSSKDIKSSHYAMFDKFLRAVLQIALVAFWTMPAKTKRLWLKNINNDIALLSRAERLKGK